ncbi:hypothetical protein AVEN_155299-1 [Araneus ventricosus]|uniref:Uncharacterized protein n=1 Tax=Araneus ventricosus TaxID=182803 RepID=A0A4Y2D6F3_ARAVE|nr:hypothetical protein AVEN_155299-1 [Araneus ventricosus]
MECLLIVWMHINRGELSIGRILPRRPPNRLRHFLHHGCLSRAFILSTQIPSKFPGRPLTTSLEVPEPEAEKTSTSFVEVQPPKKNSVSPPPPTKKARFPTSQAVTSLPSRTFSKI